MEGDSQIGGGGEKFERAASTDVPPQDAGRNFVAISDCQHVAVTNVQPEGADRREIKRLRDFGRACGVISGQVAVTQNADSQPRGRDDLEGYVQH